MSDTGSPFGYPYGATDPFQPGMVDATQEPVFAAPGGTLSTVLSEFQFAHGASGALNWQGSGPPSDGSTAQVGGGSGVAGASLAPGVGGLFSQLTSWLASIFSWT